MKKKPMLYTKIEDMLSEMLREYRGLRNIDKTFIYEGVCRKFRVSKEELKEVMLELDEMDSRPPLPLKIQRR